MRTSMRFGGVTLISAAWWMGGAPGEAAADEIGMVVAGDLAPALLEEAERVAIDRLRGSGHEVAAIDLDAAAVAGLRRCVSAGGEGACREVMTSRPELSRWLFLDATREVEPDGDGQAVMTGWWLDGRGQVLAGDRRYCASCTAGQLAASVRELIGTLLEPRAGELRTALIIRSSPSGAVVSVDGRTIGVTAMEYAVSPGAHRLRVERDGYRAEERQVTVAPGATTTVDVPLSRDESVQGSSGRGRRIAGWSLAGAGVAMIAGGAALVVLDRPEIEDGGRQAEHRDSMAWGLGIGAAGIGAASAGAWLLLSGGDEASARVAIAPTAEGGLWVQAGMRF